MVRLLFVPVFISEYYSPRHVSINHYCILPSPQIWEKYRFLRNKKEDIKRTSIKNYFRERCGGGPKSKDFWSTIKPFLSSKSLSRTNEIILKEQEKIISDQPTVCNILNDFYINIAKNIGIEDKTETNKTHPSIVKIENNNPQVDTFNFKHVSEDDIFKHFKSLNVKKATGYDGIPPKILKPAGKILAGPTSKIINCMIDKSTFPSKLKLAQVTPIFKKDDPFVPKNYRPVSILPTMSKIYEKVLNDQLNSHFKNIFNSLLSAFRSGCSCQTSLLRVVEDWKIALDRGDYVAAILMDLSKAFDCIPHSLLVLKLRAYGLSDSAADLVHNYLSDRKQMVKIGDACSTWLEVLKGVPQGSILGPMIFNIFINDIFYFIEQSDLYNYADDNTISFKHKDLTVLKSVLESESTNLIEWFNFNQMQANPDKFQAIAVGKRTHDASPVFNLGDVHIVCDDTVKLLGIDIDFMLNFNDQVTKMCKKAAMQLNVLLRLSKFLDADNKVLIYKSFIRSNFNYCPLVWHFCSQSNTEKLEKLQHRALRITFNDFHSSYKELLDRANMPTLHLSRLQDIAIETFKCLYKISPAYLHDIVQFKSNNYSFRYVNNVEIPSVKTSAYGKQSFRYGAAQVWNSLPNEIRKVENFKEFRRLIRTWTGHACKCSMCH